ncbi:non-specific lipid transfer protein GPI-anchored 14-like [Prosopis cineraria]|uniref:non-specific lipid transfer protein GPI-anchored 14-like n=1 Tax=Prosopis cineraria TaxID=364024 RepID=UPI00240FB505|nr:non-specific lipid transfer protein GPI-anchored 14-like [Prosopis cineraria]
MVFFFFFPHSTSTSHVLVLVVACVVVISGAMADSSKDKEECMEQLAGLATCLPYVGGQAKSPTSDCCSGLKQLLKNNKKCLCVIIKDRNDPDIGSLQVNITLAITLPNVCNAPANISKCPELLHMDPKSPEAQIFYQLDKGSNKSGTTPSPAPAPANGASGESGKSGSSQAQKNEAFLNRRRLLGLDALVIGLQLWAFMGFT